MEHAIPADLLDAAINTRIHLAMKKEPAKPGDIVGLKALAELLGVSVRTISKYKKKGLLPYKQIGKMVYFNHEEVLKSIQKQPA